ncbi:hypothetical protein PPERSA_04331 [Pseudocohnilembus persalinus]|uniref:Transmembrane protein n=1 Tax=Pseudocohnilembus persalinus TaxID=266149 RepID=A0A0V0QQI8_PSEPJ|nr:hypothetical protein PPERSA_04331 [Pseudocohnilembus persalinus]|eukprot:KRX04516.1 hypothetical protein PPERSA_04331 [Pseudocohnilembus persalinus]
MSYFSKSKYKSSAQDISVQTENIQEVSIDEKNIELAVNKQNQIIDQNQSISDQQPKGNQNLALGEFYRKQKGTSFIMKFYKKHFPNSRTGFIKKYHLFYLLLVSVASFFNVFVLQDELDARRIIARTFIIIGISINLCVIASHLNYFNYKQTVFACIFTWFFYALGILLYNQFIYQISKRQSIICQYLVLAVGEILSSILFDVEDRYITIIFCFVVSSLKIVEISYIHSNFAFNRFKHEMRVINQLKLERAMYQQANQN